MRIDPVLREKAWDQHRVWKSGSIAAGIAAAVGAAIASPVAVAFVLIGALGQVLADRAEQIANDPPDPEFRSSVRPKPRPFRLPTPFALNDPMRPLGYAVLAMNDAVFFLDPMIRSYERAQGAAAYGDTEALSDRLDDARRYAHAAAGQLYLLPEATPVIRQFAETVKSESVPTEAFAEPPAELILSLYESGLPRYEVQKALKLWRGARDDLSMYHALRDPWATLATTMEDTRFADALLHWLLDPSEVAADLW